MVDLQQAIKQIADMLVDVQPVKDGALISISIERVLKLVLVFDKRDVAMVSRGVPFALEVVFKENIFVPDGQLLEDFSSSVIVHEIGEIWDSFKVYLTEREEKLFVKALHLLEIVHSVLVLVGLVVVS